MKQINSNLTRKSFQYIDSEKNPASVLFAGNPVTERKYMKLTGKTIGVDDYYNREIYTDQVSANDVGY